MDDEAVVESVEPESAPDTGAETVESPAPEPEPDPAPDWLNDVDASSSQYQAEPQGPPIQDQYQQQRQQGQPAGGIDFSRFVENPESVLREFVNREVGPYIGSLVQNQQQTQAYQQQMLRGQVENGRSGVRGAINDAYKQIYSGDGGFKGNKAVRGRVERHLQDRFSAATQSAMYGDTRELASMQDPQYYGAVLALAKYLEGYHGGASPVMGTARVESPTATSSSADSPELSADMEAALSRMGGGAKEKYLANLKKYGDDIEFG